MVTESGCWEWQGAIQKRAKGRGGYAVATVGGKYALLHRAMYEYLVGSIPDGAQVDHICHNRDPECPSGSACRHRRCVNPDHLEPVRPRVNVMRGNSPARFNIEKTKCPYGHDYDATNTLVTKNGRRACRVCKKRRYDEWYAMHGAEYMRNYRARKAQDKE